MSDETQVAAFKARITTSTGAPTLDRAEAKKLTTRPGAYVLIQLSRRVIDNQARMSGTFEPNGHRLTTTAVAKGETNARRVEAAVWAALQLNPITLDGELVDVIHDLGGGEFGEPDSEGYVSAATDWKFVR